MKNSMQEQIDFFTDSDYAVVLRFLRNHITVDSEKLKTELESFFDPIEMYESVIKQLLHIALISTNKSDITITEAGQSWLEKNLSELEVEAEDTSSLDEPKKPYEVSKLKMEPKHLSIFQALRKIEKKEINLNPEFQRAFVWDKVKQSRLIESVLIRIPLPAFYLDATDQVNWSVVDGLQRLTTLFRYCREESFPLTGLQFLRELENHTFSQLPPKYKVLVEDDTQLLFYNLMPGTPVEAKFTIFSRVNTGGMQLTSQEIRHALNQGKATKLLHKVSLDSRFKKATNGVVESLRMSDRELILRALSFMHLGASHYKGFSDLDSFLLSSMSEINKLSDRNITTLENNFISSLEKVVSIFGRYSFRKFSEREGRRSPFNKALFEAWIVSVSKYDEDSLIKHKEKIIDRFINEINKLDDFTKSISSSTGSQSAVSTRFSRIAKILEETCQ